MTETHARVPKRSNLRTRPDRARPTARRSGRIRRPSQQAGVAATAVPMAGPTDGSRRPVDDGLVVALIPAHDEEHQIAEAIRSLHEQEAPPDLVVVVADNCRDDTARIAEGDGGRRDRDGPKWAQEGRGAQPRAQPAAAGAPRRRRRSRTWMPTRSWRRHSSPRRSGIFVAAWAVSAVCSPAVPAGGTSGCCSATSTPGTRGTWLGCEAKCSSSRAPRRSSPPRHSGTSCAHARMGCSLAPLRSTTRGSSPRTTS